MVRESDTLRADAGVFARVLASAPRPERRRGIQRFFDDDGRITSYPAQHAERVELLTLVATRVLEPDEVVTEAALNERLAAYSTDVALLRRHLVDASLVERTRSGSEYALPADGRQE